MVFSWESLGHVVISWCRIVETKKLLIWNENEFLDTSPKKMMLKLCRVFHKNFWNYPAHQLTTSEMRLLLQTFRHECAHANIRTTVLHHVIGAFFSHLCKKYYVLIMAPEVQSWTINFLVLKETIKCAHNFLDDNAILILRRVHFMNSFASPKTNL